MKKLFLSLTFLLLLFIISISVFIYLFDANQYKTKITDTIKSHTDYDVELHGNIDISLYPWVGLKLNNILIKNKPDFNNKTLASIHQFTIKVKMIPLLSRRIEVDQFIADRLQLNLEINTDGSNNWSNFLLTSDQTPTNLKDLSINSIKITDSNISWLDNRNGKHINFYSLNITTDNFVLGQPLPVALNTIISNNQPDWKANASLETNLSFNSNSVVFDANNLVLSVKTLPTDNTTQRSLTLTGDSAIDLHSSTLRLNNANIEIFDLNIHGNLIMENIWDTPYIHGPVSIDSFSASTLSKHFDFKLPEFNNPSSLKQLSFSADFSTDIHSFKLDKLIANIDNNQLIGFVHMSNLNDTTPIVRYDITIDNINANDYTVKNMINVPIPVNLLRNIDLKGTTRLSNALLNDIRLSDISIPLLVKQHTLTANPVSLTINQAKIKSAFVLNIADTIVGRAAIQSENLNSNDTLNPLLNKILANNTLQVNSIFSASLHLKSHGHSISDHQRTLTGKLNLNSDKLILKGIDLNHVTKKVVSDYATKNNFRTRTPYLDAINPDSSHLFTNIKTTFDITGHSFRTQTLALNSDTYNIETKGYIDFSKQELNIRSIIDRHVSNRIDIREKLIDHPMEYDVRGQFGSINTQLDFTKYDLLVGRLLMIDAKARRIKSRKEQQKNAW